MRRCLVFASSRSCAVPAFVKKGSYHAGQVCVSVQRAFAHRPVAAELGEIFTRDYATVMRAYTPLDASAVMLDDDTASRVD
jgi:acyl-CoA reductase-like NAD-dependent aldehyde dehydrogenase